MAQGRTVDLIYALAKESAWATATPPTVCVPVTKTTGTAQIPATMDDGYRGLGAVDFDATQDAGHGEHKSDGVMYPVECGHDIMAMLGTDNKTGAAAPYSHAFALASQPPSYTLEDQYISLTSGGLRFVGAKLAKLGITFDTQTKTLACTREWISKLPTKVSPVNPSPAVISPWPGWKLTTTLAAFNSGVAGALRVISGTLNLERIQNPRHTGTNTQDPRWINTGGLKVSGDLTFTVEDLTLFDLFKAGTKQILALDFTDGNTPVNDIEFTMTSAFMGDTPWEPNRPDAGVEEKMGFRGIYNATDVGPIAVVLQNAQSTAY